MSIIKEFIDGVWKGEMKCTGPKAGESDLWKNVGRIVLFNWTDICRSGTHVKAHRTEKDKKNVSHFEKFVTEGCEKADELAKEGAMCDQGYVAQARAGTFSAREKKYTQLSSMQPAFTVWWRNGGTVQNSSRSQRKVEFRGSTKRGDEALNGTVCCCQQEPMSVMWKRQQVHEDARTMYRAEILGKDFGKMVNATYGRTRYGEKNGQAGRSFDLVQKMLGLRTKENEITIDELLQAGASGHNRAWQNVETNSGSCRWQDPRQGGKALED